jgi:hypothetical protein
MERARGLQRGSGRCWYPDSSPKPCKRDEQGVANPFGTDDDRKSVYAFGVVRVALSCQPAKIPTLTFFVMEFEGATERVALGVNAESVE